MRRFANYFVNCTEANYTVNFAVNWLDSDVVKIGVVHGKVLDVVEESV